MVELYKYEEKCLKYIFLFPLKEITLLLFRFRAHEETSSVVLILLVDLAEKGEAIVLTSGIVKICPGKMIAGFSPRHRACEE